MKGQDGASTLNEQVTQMLVMLFLLHFLLLMHTYVLM